MVTNKYPCNFPKDGMRKSGRFFCYFFAVLFLTLFITFLTLFILRVLHYEEVLKSPVCAGMDVSNGLGQRFEASLLQELSTKEAIALYTEAIVNANPNLIETTKESILSKYTLKNGYYCYNLLPTMQIIDWIYLSLSIYSLLSLIVQIYAVLQLEKADYSEYYTILVFLFLSLNLPSSFLYIFEKKNENNHS